MKFCSVGIPNFWNLGMESEQTMSDALLKDTQHAWVDL